MTVRGAIPRLGLIKLGSRTAYLREILSMDRHGEGVGILFLAWVREQGLTKEELLTVFETCFKELIRRIGEELRENVKDIPKVGDLMAYPRCSLCGKGIQGKTYYQGGLPERPVHRECQISIRRTRE